MKKSCFLFLVSLSVALGCFTEGSTNEPSLSAEPSLEMQESIGWGAGISEHEDVFASTDAEAIEMRAWEEKRNLELLECKGKTVLFGFTSFVLLYAAAYKGLQAYGRGKTIDRLQHNERLLRGDNQRLDEDNTVLRNNQAPENNQLHLQLIQQRDALVAERNQLQRDLEAARAHQHDHQHGEHVDGDVDNHQDDEHVDGDVDCPICLDPVGESQESRKWHCPVNHHIKYHADCIEAINGVKKCPECRRNLVQLPAN